MTDAPISTEIVAANTVADLNEIITNMGGRAGILSTLPQGTQEERIAVAAAVSNSKSISDELGATIPVTNVVIQAVDMVNEQTGEMQTVPRVVLVDDKGNGHHAISGPLFRDVRTMLGLIGVPNLAAGDKPIKIKVLQEGSGTRKYFTLQYV